MLTASLVILGVAVFAGGVSCYISYKDQQLTSEEKEKLINEYKNKIEGNNKVIETFNDLKKQLKSGIDMLESSKAVFKDGGHVSDGIPLANNEFINCKSDVNDTIAKINILITDFENANKECETALNDLGCHISSSGNVHGGSGGRF